MHDEEHADAYLMDLVRSRDEQAFDALRLRYESPIRRLLTSIVHNADTADDLLQETLLESNPISEDSLCLFRDSAVFGTILAVELTKPCFCRQAT